MKYYDTQVMSVKPIELSENEREQLQSIIKKGSDWRERERAQTILMLSEGQTVFAVAGAIVNCGV